MKNYVGIFKILNEIIEVKRMSTIERILIRKRKDLIDILGTHLFSILRTILITVCLYVLLNQTTKNNMHTFWFFSITGFIFILINKNGYKVPFFLIKKYCTELFSLFHLSLKELNKQGNKLKEDMKNHNLFYKSIVLIIIVPITLIFAPLPYILITIIYSTVFVIVIYLNNDVLALLIGYFLGQFVLSKIQLDITTFILLMTPIIFFIVDYEVRETIGAITLISSEMKYTTSSIENYRLINSNDDLYLYQNNNNFIVINKPIGPMDIYKVESKYDVKRNKLTNFIASKKTKK